MISKHQRAADSGVLCVLPDWMARLLLFLKNPSPRSTLPAPQRRQTGFPCAPASAFLPPSPPASARSAFLLRLPWGSSLQCTHCPDLYSLTRRVNAVWGAGCVAGSVGLEILSAHESFPRGWTFGEVQRCVSGCVLLSWALQEQRLILPWSSCVVPI